MACTSWAEYCRLWSETGLFDDTKLFGTTYTHDCPVYYGIKGELFPIEISGNTATESVYIAKANTLGEFFIGIPNINNTNTARSFQLMLKYCNPITALIDGCKCFTMSFQVKEQDSYFYTLDEVLSVLMNNQAEVYLLDAGANGVKPSWQGKKEKQDLIDKYSNLPSRWLKAYIFDYSLEDITNAPKPHSQIRGKSISLNDDKDTKPTDPLKAITPIMDAALARLAQSGDEAKLTLAKAFKQVDKVESTLECGEDLFCLSETNPNSKESISFTGCMARLKGKVKFTFGPSIKDLIQVKLTFDSLVDALSRKAKDEPFSFVNYSLFCEIYGWDDTELKKCCKVNSHIVSPSTGSGSWKDKDLWSKYTFFTTYSLDANNNDKLSGNGIIVRKSYAHFMLSSAPLLKRLVFSDNLLKAIKECFDALHATLLSQGNDPEEGLPECQDCNWKTRFEGCLGCASSPETEQSPLDKLLLQCSGSITTTKCTGVLELSTLEQLIFIKRITTTTLTATCPSGLTCKKQESQVSAREGMYAYITSSCAPLSPGSTCNFTSCICKGEIIGCCNSHASIMEDSEKCPTCEGYTVIENPNCSIASSEKYKYEIVKKYYNSKSNCLLQTITSGTGATWSIPFLNLNFEKYVEACLSGNTPRSTITIPNADGGGIPYDPADPDDPNHPDNGGDGDQPKPGGGNGSGDKPEPGGGTDHPQPDPFHNCPKDQEDVDETKPTIPGLYYFGPKKNIISYCTRSVTINGKVTRLSMPVYKITKKWVRCSNAFWEFRKDPDAYSILYEGAVRGGDACTTIDKGINITTINALKTEGDYYEKKRGMTPILRCSNGNDLYYVPQNSSLPIVSSNFYFSNKSELEADSGDGSYYQVKGESNIPGFRYYYPHLIDSTLKVDGWNAYAQCSGIIFPMTSPSIQWTIGGEEAKSAICGGVMPSCANKENDPVNYSISSSISVSIRGKYEAEGHFTQI